MLEKIQSLFDSLDKKQLITLAIVAIVCIVVLAYYLYRCINPIQERFAGAKEVDENMTDYKENFNNNEVNMRLFHVDWCGYCQKAKPHFNEFMVENNGKTINGRKVNIEMIDCESEDNKSLVSKFEDQISGYPTIILTKDGENIQYKGDRENKSHYLSWLTDMLN